MITLRFILPPNAHKLLDTSVDETLFRLFFKCKRDSAHDGRHFAIGKVVVDGITISYEVFWTKTL